MRDKKEIIDENIMLRSKNKFLKNELKKMKEDMKEGFKRCNRCDMYKPHRMFYKNKATSDGLANYCKSCISEKYYKQLSTGNPLTR